MIEENLKSDDIEIVALYTEILLKNRGVDYVKTIFKEEGNYSLIEEFNRFKLVKNNTFKWQTYSVTGSSQYSYWNAEDEETVYLTYKIKTKTNKIPMYNSFLKPKNNKYDQGRKRATRNRI